MKTLRLHGLHNLQLHDEPKPIPTKGQLLLKVRSVGICGSDLHWFAEQGIGDARLTRPLVLGHEFSAVTESGERVAVEPAIPCGACDFCRRGHPNLCPTVIFAGHGGQDGALREYMAWDEKCLFHLPDSLTNDDGAMLEPLGVAIHSIDLGHLKAGMTIGVFGCGVIGLMIVQLAKLSGATNIIATDILSHRVDAAKALGAQHALLVEDRRGVDQVFASSQGRGLDVAFEVAGDQDAVEAAIAAVVPGGKVILVGIPADDKTSFPASLARRKGLTIKVVRRMKHTYPRAIELVTKGLVEVRSLVTHHFGLDQAAQAFEVAERREGIKVIIEVNSEN
jgi:L-iditol 2-dehydrogenase